MTSFEPSPETVVAAARRWIGTPYHHQASRQGAGTDCLGLIRGLWREFYGEEPEAPPPYTRDWARQQGRETMIEAFDRYLIPVLPLDRQALPIGAVVLFRFKPGQPAQHAAVVSGADAIVHAYDGARAVTEDGLPPSWRRVIVRAYSFPPAGV